MKKGWYSIHLETNEAIEYYRYERNRGMNYNIKEALSKVCCCCCKIKKIEQKVKIFDESGKEIEKILDTTSVIRFAQQSKQLKTLLLGSGSVMMNYMVRQNISYNHGNLNLRTEDERGYYENRWYRRFSHRFLL